MEPNFNRCEDEKIHLLAQIQDFGFLIVVDASFSVLACSENLLDLAKMSLSDVMNRSVKEMIAILLSSPSEEIFVDLVPSIQEDRLRMFDVKVGDVPFHLSIYASGDYFYFEFERRTAEDLSVLTCYSFIQSLNREESAIWNSLCKVIRNITQYDRTMLYKFAEDGSGVVIAEQKSEELTSYLNLHYPESDIPKQARALYLKNPCRSVADIRGKRIPLVGRAEEPVDLTYSGIRALSPVHLQYLENAGVEASLSFSVIIQGQLWGLVTCQNVTPKHVDLGHRRVALTMVQYAVNKYQAELNKLDLMSYERIREFELLLAAELMEKSNTFQAIRQLAVGMMDIVQADGLAVVRNDEVMSFGYSPRKENLLKLEQHFDESVSDTVFACAEFGLNHPDIFGGDPVPEGVGWAKIVRKQTFSIFWFRKEYEVSEDWAGKPEKNVLYDESSQMYQPSPRLSFEVWRKSVLGKSKAWSRHDRKFIESVQQVVRDNLLRKSEKIKALNQELVALNNSLDTYAYTITHDLKNPLSAIKLYGQMMQYRKDGSADFLEKASATILESVTLMEDLMSKVLEFSRAKVYEFEPELVDIMPIVTQIATSALVKYNLPKDAVVMSSSLHPLMGEKTLFYQLFLNVINNGIKYSSKVAYPEVHITSLECRDSVKYIIRDNGIGMAPEEVENIYVMFKRLSNSDAFEGSGVGMSIVKRIADRLGVVIDIQSELGKGTEITMTFPVNTFSRVSNEGVAIM